MYKKKKNDSFIGIMSRRNLDPEKVAMIYISRKTDPKDLILMEINETIGRFYKLSKKCVWLLVPIFIDNILINCMSPRGSDLYNMLCQYVYLLTIWTNCMCHLKEGCYFMFISVSIFIFIDNIWFKLCMSP